ncbi:MAG: prepilin peptidase [Chloroflexi bacterium]|nr:prepilin peptidase [Chloroflexota bacterium]
MGALAFGALAARWAEPRDMVILVAWFAALMVLLATDLDRRHLPDLLTLPLMPIALLLVVAGFDPLLEGSELGLVSAIAAGIGAPIVLAASSRLLRGGIGAGDLKLAVSLGLFSGASRLGAGVVLALAASSIVLMVLLVTRRLSRNSVIPFGPVLIAGGFLAALLG